MNLLLGKRLKELRGKRTQQEIADRLNISRARYSHYENDHVQPDNDLLQKMADIYNTTVDDLLGRKPILIKEEKSTYSVRPYDGIMKDIADKYPGVDLNDPDIKRKLMKMIDLVLDDYEKK